MAFEFLRKLRWQGRAITTAACWEPHPPELTCALGKEYESVSGRRSVIGAHGEDFLPHQDPTFAAPGE